MRLVAIAAIVAATLALRGALAQRARAGVRRRLGGPAVAASTPVSLPDRTTVLAVSGAALSGWAIGEVIGAVAAALAAVLVLRVRVARAERVSPVITQERFADAVGAIAAAVRAGSSLPQAIGYAAHESALPVRDELERLVAELDIGVPLELAVDAWRERVDDADTDLVVGALELHRRSGGDLPAVLDQVSTTVRARVSVEREVRSLTAQARLSAWILGLLPVGFFAFLWLTARSDIEGAMSTPVGVACLGIGLVLEGAAFLWIRSLLVVA